MGVARQVGEHGLRSGEGFLGIDDPLGLAQRREEGIEGGPVCETGLRAEEGEAAAAMEPGEPLEEQASEQPRQHPHREEEGLPAGDPSLAVRRQTATRHDHVHMGVVGHR